MGAAQVQYHLEQKLITWYRTHGLKKVNERVRKYQFVLGVEAHSVQLKTQHKRWGSCTPTGDIYVNWRIVMAPVHVMDYIIVHELSHLLVPEHNDRLVGYKRGRSFMMQLNNLELKMRSVPIRYEKPLVITFIKEIRMWPRCSKHSAINHLLSPYVILVLVMI